jgi:hypothetical protein
MRGQAQVIVAGELDDGPAIELDLRLIGAGTNAQAAQKAIRL